MGMEEMKKQLEREQRRAEKAEILTSVVKTGTVEAIDLPYVRIEHDEGRTYIVDREIGVRTRDVTSESGFLRSIFEEHLKDEGS